MKRFRACDLQSTERLLRLHSELATDIDEETLVALSVRALHDGRNPAALFRWMILHPESWEWLSDADLTEARRKLQRRQRRRIPSTTKKSYSDCSVKRYYGVNIDRKRFRSTGWEAEAEATVTELDERFRRRAIREGVDRIVSAFVLVGATLWLLW